MTRIKIKPLSINFAWGGRTFKSKAYKVYEEELGWLLPKIKIPKGKLRAEFIVGYSSRASDIDNFLKPFIDCLQRQYNFNDNSIYELNIKKEITKKGEEFIDFNITSIK